MLEHVCYAMHLSEKEKPACTAAGELVTQPLSIMDGGTMQLQFLVGAGYGGQGVKQIRWKMIENGTI